MRNICKICYNNKYECRTYAIELFLEVGSLEISSFDRMLYGYYLQALKQAGDNQDLIDKINLNRPYFERLGFECNLARIRKENSEA